ncbi:MAG: hypothetical protein Q8L77_18505, partial [Nitrospirota bacterium]|nr:hypothetical protein [Nitrospirota bacterium]MDP3595653.1 hypothetical protein [Nitrospirota bacterium]
MTNEGKCRGIRRWIAPEKRITAHVLDAQDLSATGTKITGQFDASEARQSFRQSSPPPTPAV